MTDRLQQLNEALEDRYRLEKEIGRGGMATVYLAHDLKHDRQVAVKVMHPEIASSLGVERFLREVQITARLSHPNILTLIDSGQAGEVLFYVLPYVAGESLQERLSREGGLDLVETARLIEQIAGALDYAHEQGVLHRDIKPANILLHRGAAMVTDFGIAVGLAAARDERITATGTSIGTPSYMSPEQVQGDREVNARSDVYAVGCLAYEMLVGEPPFTGTPQTIFAKILTTDPPDVSEGRDDVPRAACRAISRAHARSPEARFATVGEFANALRKATIPAVPRGGGRPHRVIAVPAIAVTAVVAYFGWSVVSSRGTGETTVAVLADIDRAMLDRDRVTAWQLARSIEGEVTDSTMERIWSEVAVLDTIVTTPPGASVSWRGYAVPDDEWKLLGVTPLEMRVPQDLIALRLELDGHEPRIVGSMPRHLTAAWRLEPDDGQPPDVVHVPAEERVSLSRNSATLGAGPNQPVGEFLIDKYEVTNARYQKFVDAGGYATPEFWEHPIEHDDRILKWDEAMALMVDRTGRPGPATWEVGTYPEGTAEHPVTGVSWYEALAFARWAGRSIPTLYHWYAASWTFLSWSMVPFSNLEGTGTRPVGEGGVVTPTGVSDMAGNAREWVINAQGIHRFAVGGGWEDPDYHFQFAHPLPPLDRGRANGFRLISYLGDSTELTALSEPVARLERDFSTEPPVSDEIFDVFRSLYDYDRPPLNAEIERVDTVRAGFRQRITMDTADGDDRVILYLFLPSDAAPPLQTVFFWPGSAVLTGAQDIEDFFARAGYYAPALVQSGRAVALPVFESMWEREDDYEYSRQDPSNDHRDHVISWRQDMGRILDYLETRPDIDSDGFSYVGVSWGGRMGAIMLAVEPRFRAGVLHVGGLSLRPTQPVVEPLNFAPRVTTPVLMLNGRYDMIYPLETQSKPLFELLGSEEKFHYISDGGHNVPYLELIRETLRWLDTYVGPVE